jgi:hypothetical protein
MALTIHTPFHAHHEWNPLLKQLKACHEGGICMGVINYSDHVKVSSLAQGKSRGLERGKAVPVQAKHVAWPGASRAW